MIRSILLLFSVASLCTVSSRAQGPGGVSAPLIWFRADAGTSTTTNGAGISTWTNQGTGSGSGTQSAASLQPTYQNDAANLINFNPVVKFSSQYFDLSAANFGDGIARTAANIFLTSKNDGSSPFSSSSLYIEQTNSINPRVNIHQPFSNGNLYWDGGNDNDMRIFGSISATGFNTLSPILWGYTAQGSGAGNQQIRNNGTVKVQSAVTTPARPAISYQFTTNFSQSALGVYKGGSPAYWLGRLPEIIGFGAALTALQVQQIESYLAVKYGITKMDNYLASNGTTVTYNTGSYANNIAGIGRDDNSLLLQKQSRSVTTGVITGWTGASALPASNAANTQTIATDRSFIIWGDDGATANASAGNRVAGNLPAVAGTCITRLQRQWKVQRSGTNIGAINIQVDFAGLGLPSGTRYENVSLLVYRKGSSGTYAANDAYNLVSANQTGVISGTKVTFNSITFDTDNDGIDYFYVVFNTQNAIPSPPANGSSATGVAALCTDFNGYTQFADDATTPALKYTAIKATTGTLGSGTSITANNNVTFTGTTATNGTYQVQVRSTGGTGTAYATALVRRMLIVPSNIAAAGSTYTVRVYYDAGENTYAQAQALAAAQTLDPMATSKAGRWYKYEDNTTSGSVVAGAQAASPDGFSSGINTFLSPAATGTENGVAWVEFSNITSFSTFGFLAAAGSPNTTPLPIGLSAFEARKDGGDALLSWVTSNETNAARFDIEHSMNGRDFTIIGTVTAAGRGAASPPYAFRYHQQDAGDHYYRLRLVDNNGSHDYSAVRMLRQSGMPALQVKPNPVSETLAISGLEAGMQIRLIGMDGRELMSRAITGPLEMLQVAALPPGIYRLQVWQEGALLTTLKVVRQ